MDTPALIATCMTIAAMVIAAARAYTDSRYAKKSVEAEQKESGNKLEALKRTTDDVLRDVDALRLQQHQAENMVARDYVRHGQMTQYIDMAIAPVRADIQNINKAHEQHYAMLQRIIELIKDGAK